MFVLLFLSFSLCLYTQTLSDGGAYMPTVCHNGLNYDTIRSRAVQLQLAACSADFDYTTCDLKSYVSGLVMCVNNTAVNLDSKCCPSNCFPCRTECPSVKDCVPGTAPTISTNAGLRCPSCKVVIPRCPEGTYSALTLCAVDIHPTVNLDTGCPACKPRPAITCELTSLEHLQSCVSGVLPTITNGCPTCRPTDFVPPANKCTLDQVRACENSFRDGSLRECAPDTRPTLSSATCCFDCHVRDHTESEATSCRTSFPNAPSCATNAYPDSPDSICRICRKPAHDLPSTCTHVQFLANHLTVPECLDGEVRVFDRTKCVASCRRPELRFPPTAVARCRSLSRACVPGEAPRHLKGFPCRHCEPLKQPFGCNPACANSMVCVPHRKEDRTIDFSTAPVCSSETCKVFAISSSLVAIANEIAAMTDEHRRFLIHELIERYCDRGEHRDECAAARSSLDQLRVTTTILIDGKQCPSNFVCLRICVPSILVNKRGEQVSTLVTIQSAIGSPTSGSIVGGSSTVIASLVLSLCMLFMFLH